SLEGFNTQHSIHLITKELFETLGQPARSWIFQAVPGEYDIRPALKTLKKETFQVTRYEDEIGLGDRVYICEAGKNAGIVGVADVIENPRIQPSLPESKPFELDRSRFEPDQLRVLLRVLRNVDPAVSRDQIKALPALSNLSILIQPRGTNF